MRSNVYGLSLCIQGTPRPAHFFQTPERFIPVYTGNTFAAVCVMLNLAVYPCVYREHIAILQDIIDLDGLSLCIQGTPYPAEHEFTKKRFIPVYTGNTQNAHLPALTHPGLSLCIQGTRISSHII